MSDESGAKSAETVQQQIGMPGSRRNGSFSTGPDASNAFIPTLSSAFSSPSTSTSTSDRVSYS